MTITFLDDLIDGHVFETGVLRQKLAVAALPYPRGPSNDDIRFLSCHGLRDDVQLPDNALGSCMYEEDSFEKYGRKRTWNRRSLDKVPFLERRPRAPKRDEIQSLYTLTNLPFLHQDHRST